jgi:hypothetical protein
MNMDFADNFRLVTHSDNKHGFSVKHIGAVYTQEYWAVSYEWGTVTKETDYDCGWLVPEKHTNAVGDIVRLIHSKMECHALWMDALCVDQSSDDDKEAQIPLMGKYYNSCAGTVVKLTGTYEVEFIALEALADSIGIFVDELRETRFGDLKDVDMHKNLDDVLLAVSRICDDSWFTRVWTMQEYVLPKKVVLMDNVGNMLDGDKFEKCTSISYIYDHLQQMGKVDKVFTKNMTGMRWIWSRLEHTPSISQVLRNVKGRECSREEDYVYGVLGLLKGKYVVKYGIGLSNAIKSIVTQCANQGDITGLMSEEVGLEDINGYTFMHNYDMWSNVSAISQGNIFTFKDARVFPEVSRVILSEPNEPMHPDRLAYRIRLIINHNPMLGVAVIAAFLGTHPTSTQAQRIAMVGRQIGSCTPLDCMDIWRRNLGDIGLFWYQIVFKASEWTQHGRSLYVSELMLNMQQCFMMWVGYPTKPQSFGCGVDIHCRADQISIVLMMVDADNRKIGVCFLNPTIRFVQGYIVESMDIRF